YACLLLIGTLENRRPNDSWLSEIAYIFQTLTDGDPQLVHTGLARSGRSRCQANYFRIFLSAPGFSYSPEKGLNHNGFVKMCRRGMPLEPASTNQIP
ncbi:hypothetical protein, partial [Mesorhizobium sp. M7A.F.Ca.US.006.04.2.1]|uniref:hypothetical protein n=1 Tax=Mesorhizobium sp. M7A.F.Ca.US.006.04.2.1 TaxID=2496696 RepID=UPI0019D4C57E